MYSELLEIIIQLKSIYTITWLLCAFSLVVDRDLLNDTPHTDEVKSTPDHFSVLVFHFFHVSECVCPLGPSVLFLSDCLAKSVITRMFQILLLILALMFGMYRIQPVTRPQERVGLIILYYIRKGVIFPRWHISDCHGRGTGTPNRCEK